MLIRFQSCFVSVSVSVIAYSLCVYVCVCVCVCVCVAHCSPAAPLSPESASIVFHFFLQGAGTI